MKNKKVNISPIALRLRAYVIWKETRGGLDNIKNEEIYDFFEKIEPFVEGLIKKGTFVKKVRLHREPAWSPCNSVYDTIVRVNENDYLFFEEEIRKICKS